MPQEPIVPVEPKENIVKSPGPEKKNKKRLLLIVAVLLLVGAGIVAAIYLTRDTSKPTASNDTKPDSPNQAKHSVFCLDLGLQSVQCEDLTTKEIRKYELPESVGNITTSSANKSGNKILVNAIATETNEQTYTVYDTGLKALTSLPAANDNYLADVQWLDDNTVVYTTGASNNTKTIHTLDVASGKKTELMTTTILMDRIMASGDKRYIYCILAPVDKVSDSIVRKLGLIDTQTKTIKEVVNTVIDVNRQDLAYSQADKTFYADILLQEQQLFNTATFEVDGFPDQPILRAGQTITNTHYLSSYAYKPVITDKGFLAGTPETDFSLRPPALLYAATDKYYELGLSVSGKGGIQLQLHGFPNFPRAKTDEAVTRDFFKPPANTPDKIVSFLDKMVTEAPDCKKGEYTSFILRTNDGDKQFSVSQSGCSSDYLAVYKLDGDTYKKVAYTQEGMSCEQRDSLGITAKTYPDCRMPGDEL